MENTLFTDIKLTADLRITRLVGRITSQSQSYDDLKRLIEECEDLYPGIDSWFKKRVKTGLRSGERTAWVVYNKNAPIAATVLRKGSDAKLCSMRILPDEQNKGLGSLMLTLVATEILKSASQIHFTLPKELWHEKRQFFTDFGFVNQGTAPVQYRLFDKELVCRADFCALWKGILRKLPSVIEKLTSTSGSSDYDLVLSIRPQFVNRLLMGSKRIEIRRKFSPKWKGANVVFYASHPRREFIGEGKITEVIVDNPDTIWNNMKYEIGCTNEEFVNYCYGASKVYALIFTDIRAFRTPILLSQMQDFVQMKINPPQSYCGIKKETIWPVALYLSWLLPRTAKADCLSF